MVAPAKDINVVRMHDLKILSTLIDQGSVCGCPRGSVSGQCTFAVELVRHIVEGAAKPLGDGLDLWRLDDQRRREHQAVADRAHNQAVPLRSGADASTDAERWLERNAGLAILHELHTEDEAKPAHVADKPMSRDLPER